MNDPWNLIGNLIIALIVLVVLTIIIAVSRILLHDYKQRRRSHKAHAGKLTCEAPTCQHKATYRTPVGFYCDNHRAEFATKTTRYAKITWSTPLDYVKKTRGL